jgi:hypothetical protein
VFQQTKIFKNKIKDKYLKIRFTNSLNHLKILQNRNNPAKSSITTTNKLNAISIFAVAQLVEALCYKPEGRGFDSRWCQIFH